MWTKTLCGFFSSLDVSYITCGALWLSGVLVGPDVEAAAAADATLLPGGGGPTSAQTSGRTLTPGGRPSAEAPPVLPGAPEAGQPGRSHPIRTRR